MFINSTFNLEKVGCPENHIKLDSFTCVKFLDDSDQCRDGCSRFTAMEECELTGGFLLDNVGDQNLDSLLDQIGSRSQFQNSFWWTGASDFRLIEIIYHHKQF